MPLAVDVAEAARLLQVSSSTVSRLIRDGRIASITVGRSRRVPRSELERFITEEMQKENA